MSNYHSHAQDMYNNNPSSRSPGTHRHQPQPQQQLRRQQSRQFDAYGTMPATLYEDSLARFDSGQLDRLGSGMPGNSYNYDMPGSQTWNANGVGVGRNLGSIGSASATASGLRSNVRGRTALPTVCLPTVPFSFHYHHDF